MRTYLAPALACVCLSARLNVTACPCVLKRVWTRPKNPTASVCFPLQPLCLCFFSCPPQLVCTSVCVQVCLHVCWSALVLISVCFERLSGVNGRGTQSVSQNLCMWPFTTTKKRPKCSTFTSRDKINRSKSKISMKKND